MNKNNNTESESKLALIPAKSSFSKRKFYPEIIVEDVKLISIFEEAKKKESEQPKWWSDIIRVDVDSIARGNNNTRWIQIIYIEGDTEGSLIIKSKDETLAFGIKAAAPTDKISSDGEKYRSFDPAITIQKYSDSSKGSDGNYFIPEGSKISKYYTVMEYLNEIINDVFSELIDAASKLTSKNSPKRDTLPSTLFCNQTTFGKIKPADKKGVVVVSNDQIIQLVKTTRTVENDLVSVVNPTTNIRFNFDAKTKELKTQIVNRKKPIYKDEKIVNYEPYKISLKEPIPLLDSTDKIEEEEIGMHNLHLVFTQGSGLSLLVPFKSVCLSQFGISCPTKVGAVAVEKKDKGPASLKSSQLI